MKIFVFAPGYPDHENLYANIFIRDQVNALYDCGNTVTVLHAKIYPSSKILSRVNHGIKCIKDEHAVRYVKPVKSFLYKAFPRCYARQCQECFEKLFEAAVKEQGMPDVVYAHFSCYAGFSACKIGERYNIPVVTIEHSGCFLTSNVGKWQLSCLKYSLTHSERFICVSSNQKEVINRISGGSYEIEVVPNMIDERFVYVPAPQSGSFVFLSVANLYKGKNIDFLVRAFCDEFGPEEDVFLRICGDGEQRRKIENLISKAGRNRDIVLLGRVGRDEIEQEYKNCNCFVLPSGHETFGIVYREALCTGAPIITTDHGGFSDSEWNDCMGLRIPVGDYQALKRSLRFMFENAGNYDREKIADISSQLYSRESVKKRLNNILSEACNRKRG